MPVIHGAGAGVTGLMLYVTHDVGSRDTAARVAWTASVNLPVDDAPSCGKLMRRTVNDAADLKAAAGVATTGRKLKKPFEHMSISWAPDERPTKDEMKAAALEAIEARGYSGCQAFIACHKDRDHRHVHIVTCRVDPKTGLTRKPTHARKLQRWAEDYEQRTGGLRIPNRRERRLVREHNAQEIRAAVKEERRPALRRMPPIEVKRSRGPTGHAIRTRTAAERREWSALLSEQECGDTAATPAQARTGRVTLARRQTGDRLQAGNEQAERFERFAAAAEAAVSPMQRQPVPERPLADSARVPIEAPAAVPPPMQRQPVPERPLADSARVPIEAPAAVPPPMQRQPVPERPLADSARVPIEAPAAVPPPMQRQPVPERPLADSARVPIEASVPEEPPLLMLPAPPRPPEQPSVPPPPRPPEQPSVPPPPRPDPRDEERKHRGEMELQLSPVHTYAMDRTERVGGELVAACRPAPTRALWDAVLTRLDDEHAATPIQTLRQDIERELVAVADHGSRGSSRRPPPQPEAIAETVQAVQDAAAQLIRPGLEELGLDLPPRTGAPADEQLAPPPTDTPAAPTAAAAPTAPQRADRHIHHAAVEERLSLDLSAEPAAPADEPPAPPAADTAQDDEPAARGYREITPDRGGTDPTAEPGGATTPTPHRKGRARG